MNNMYIHHSYIFYIYIHMCIYICVYIYIYIYIGFLGGSGKESACQCKEMQETQDQFLG